MSRREVARIYYIPPGGTGRRASDLAVEQIDLSATLRRLSWQIWDVVGRRPTLARHPRRRIHLRRPSLQCRPLLLVILVAVVARDHRPVHVPQHSLDHKARESQRRQACRKRAPQIVGVQVLNLKQGRR